MTAYHKVLVNATGQSVTLKLQRKNGKLVAIRHASPCHMLQRPQAWAFNEEVIEFFKEHDVDEIAVHCDGQEWRCSLERFLALSVPFDRGFGKQRFLPLRYWTVKEEERRDMTCGLLK